MLFVTCFEKCVPNIPTFQPLRNTLDFSLFAKCFQWLADHLILSDIEKLFGNCTFKKTYFDVWKSCFLRENACFTQIRGMRRFATEPPYCCDGFSVVTGSLL